MATQYFKRNLLLNLYREGKKSLICFLLLLKRDKNVWHLQAISSVWRLLAFLPDTLSVFWSLSLSKEISCTTAYITERSLKHLCSIRAWIPLSFFLSLSLSLRLSLSLSYRRLRTARSRSIKGPQHVDFNPPGSSVYRILQARILEWVAISSSMGSSDPGIEPGSPAL